MTPHLRDDEIRAYRERSLPAAQLLAFSDHLSACEVCRERLAAPREVVAGVGTVRGMLQAEAASAHVGYEEIAAYVDGTTTAQERNAVEAHTRECPSCASDLAEIQALRVELEGPRPVAAPPGGWRNAWRALWGWRGGLVLAGAACGIFVILLVRVPGGSNVAEVAQSNAKAPGTLAQPQAGAVIRDGTRVISVTDGRFSGLEALAQSDRALLEKAWADNGIGEAASLRDVVGSRGVLLGGSAAPAAGKLLEPVGKVVENQQPILRWESVPGASYRVSLYDSNYDEVAASGWISAAEWQVPKALRRGARYSWQLGVRQNGAEFTLPAPPASEARFRVLGEQEEADISRVRSQSGDSHLVLGILYARAGLLDEAENELRALQDQNPTSEKIAALLSSIARLRGGAQ